MFTLTTIRPRPRKKVQGDCTLAQLSAEQQTQVDRWLMKQNCTSNHVAQLVLKELGERVGRPQIEAPKKRAQRARRRSILRQILLYYRALPTFSRLFSRVYLTHLAPWCRSPHTAAPFHIQNRSRCLLALRQGEYTPLRFPAWVHTPVTRPHFDLMEVHVIS